MSNLGVSVGGITYPEIIINDGALIAMGFWYDLAAFLLLSALLMSVVFFTSFLALRKNKKDMETSISFSLVICELSATMVGVVFVIYTIFMW